MRKRFHVNRGVFLDLRGDPRHGLPLGDIHGDLVRQDAAHLRMLDLRDGEQVFTRWGDVDGKDVAPFADACGREDFVAGERAVGFHLDAGDVVFRVLPEKPAQRLAPAEPRAARRAGDEDEDGKPRHAAARAVLDGLSRADLDIEQVLVFALARRGGALIGARGTARGFDFCGEERGVDEAFHVREVLRRAARESSMIRSQSSP